MSSNLNWSRVLTCGDTTCDSSNFEDPGTPEFHYLGRLESEAVADSSTPDKRDLPPLQDQPTAPHHGLRLSKLHNLGKRPDTASEYPEDTPYPPDEHATHVYHHHQHDPPLPVRYLVEGVLHPHEQGGHNKSKPEYLGVKPPRDDHCLDPMDVAREETAATTVYRDKDNNPRYVDCMGPPPPLCPNSNGVHHQDFLPGYNSHLPPPPNNQRLLLSSEGGGSNFSHGAFSSPEPDWPPGPSSHNQAMQHGGHQAEFPPSGREKHNNQEHPIPHNLYHRESLHANESHSQLNEGGQRILPDAMYSLPGRYYGSANKPPDERPRGAQQLPHQQQISREEDDHAYIYQRDQEHQALIYHQHHHNLQSSRGSGRQTGKGPSLGQHQQSAAGSSRVKCLVCPSQRGPPEHHHQAEEDDVYQGPNESHSSVSSDYLQRRERNNLAVRKSREKAKQYFTQLQKTERYFQDKNLKLENQIDQLTGQVQKMRKLYKRLKEEGYV